MNVDKMRRHMARNTPDSVWLTLDVSRDDATQTYEKWRDRWMRMMDIKYAKEKGTGMKTIHAYESQLLDQPHHVRIQLVIA